MSAPKKPQDAAKKVRSDSVLGSLSEERKEQIEEWAETPKSDGCPGGLKHALEQLEADGIKVSISTLSGFLKYRRFAQRFSFAASRAEQAAELLRQKSPDMDPDRIRELAQSVFTLEAMDSGDAATYVNLEHLKLSQDSARTKFSLEERKLELAERRVKVMERKLDQLKGALTEGELSDEQRVLRMKQVFGL